MEAKRMRFSAANSNLSINSEKLELKLWQNNLISKCDDENYINKLLETTRNLLEVSEEITIQNEAISSAISTFGLKKSPYDMFEYSTGSDDLNLPSTSSQCSSTSSTVEIDAVNEAINSAISSFGLHKSEI